MSTGTGGPHGHGDDGDDVGGVGPDGSGAAGDPDGQDQEPPDWEAVREVRDAAVGISRVAEQPVATLRGRDRRNQRERDRRAQDKELGIDSEHKSVSDIQKMLAVAADPHTYELASMLPQPVPSGRRRRYPPWVWMLTGAGVEAYGNAKNTVTQFAGPLLWPALLTAVATAAGEDEVRGLRDEGPPERHHWTYLTRLWEADPDLRAGFHEAFRWSAVEKALAQGRLDPAAPFSLADPDLDHWVHADGAVLGSPSRAMQPVTVDPETGGLLLCRYDTARGLWWQGGTGHRAALGSHWNMLWNRGDRYGSRLLLDARHQPVGYPGAEGAMLLEMFKDLVAIAPGVQGILTDGIWHDKHLRPVFDIGRAAVSPVAARRAGKGWREPNSHALPDAVHRTPSGTCRHVQARARRAGRRRLPQAQAEQLRRRPPTARGRGPRTPTRRCPDQLVPGRPGPLCPRARQALRRARAPRAPRARRDRVRPPRVSAPIRPRQRPVREDVLPAGRRGIRQPGGQTPVPRRPHPGLGARTATPRDADEGAHDQCREHAGPGGALGPARTTGGVTAGTRLLLAMARPANGGGCRAPCRGVMHVRTATTTCGAGVLVSCQNGGPIAPGTLVGAYRLRSRSGRAG